MLVAVFAKFEPEIMRERVLAGLARRAKAGVSLSTQDRPLFVIVKWAGPPWETPTKSLHHTVVYLEEGK